MRILWDEPKRLSNLDKHGMDFADLTKDFFATSTVYPATGKRLIAIGNISEKAVTVVFAPLGSEAISIISMRSASPKERRQME